MSTLTITDPELIEVLTTSPSTKYSARRPRYPYPVDGAARRDIASQAVNEYRVMVGAALTVGVTPVEVKEIVYQAVPYVGLAKVFDFLHATNEVLTDRGIELPLPGRSTTTPEDRMDVGLATQKQVVGADAVDAMYARSPADELHIQRYLSGNCFGDHVARGGLDLATRELLTFAMLAALGGCRRPAQGSHGSEPPRQQQPLRAARGPHAPAAVPRLPPHPQRLHVINEIAPAEGQ